MSELLPDSTLFHVDLKLTDMQFMGPDLLEKYIKPAVNCLQGMNRWRHSIPQNIKLILVVLPGEPT